MICIFANGIGCEILNVVIVSKLSIVKLAEFVVVIEKVEVGWVDIGVIMGESVILIWDEEWIDVELKVIEIFWEDRVKVVGIVVLVDTNITLQVETEAIDIYAGIVR